MEDCGSEQNEILAADYTRTGRGPTCQENKRARIVKIIPLDHGYMVDVGCQSFAIETTSKLMTTLHEYLNDPRVVEKFWLEGKFNL